MSELRCSNLAGIGGASNGKDRTVVSLTFTKGTAEAVVGSSIVDGHRLYTISNVKVTKTKFSQFIVDKFGFAKESVSWNISQRAVQDIVRLLFAILLKLISLPLETIF